MPILNDILQVRRQIEMDGFATVPELLTYAQVAALQLRVDALFTSTRPKSKQVLYVDGHVPEDTPPLDDLLHQWLNPHRFGSHEGTSNFLEAPRAFASQLLDAEPVLFQDLLLVKEMGQQRFPWHQDFPFWPIDRPEAVVCWIPLVSNEIEGGGLRFARASHRLGEQPIIDLHRGTQQDRSDPTYLLQTAYEIVCPRLQAGDAVFFSPLIFHSSMPRTLAGQRAAWSSIWLDPTVRWSHRRVPAHPVCRQVTDGEFVHPLDKSPS